jgi:hypothetical protein
MRKAGSTMSPLFPTVGQFHWPPYGALSSVTRPERFLAEYESRLKKEYGFLRPIIEQVVDS